jgi:hypothetical protein
MFFINQNHQMRTEDYSLLLAIKRDKILNELVWFIPNSFSFIIRIVL